MEDLLGHRLRHVSEVKATRVTQLLVCLYGTGSVALSYGISLIKGPLTQMALSIFGVCGGPIFGVFLAGVTVPWVHKRGALAGQLLSFCFSLWIAVGNQLYGRQVQKLPPPPTDGCFLLNQNGSDIFTEAPQHYVSNSSIHYDFITNATSTYINSTDFSTSENTAPANPYAFGFFFYDISYEWYALIGTFVSFWGSVIFSITKNKSVNVYKVNSNLVLPWSRRYWNLPDPRDSDTGDGVRKRQLDSQITGFHSKNSHFVQDSLEPMLKV